MVNTTIVPKHIAEAIVSPRAHAEPIERDALLSCLRYLRVTNPVGLVEAHGFDPFWLISLHRVHDDGFWRPDDSRPSPHHPNPPLPDICSSSLSDIAVALPRQFLTSHTG